MNEITEQAKKKRKKLRDIDGTHPCLYSQLGKEETDKYDSKKIQQKESIGNQIFIDEMSVDSRNSHFDETRSYQQSVASKNVAI